MKCYLLTDYCLLGGTVLIAYLVLKLALQGMYSLFTNKSWKG